MCETSLRGLSWKNSCRISIPLSMGETVMDLNDTCNEDDYIHVYMHTCIYILKDPKPIWTDN